MARKYVFINTPEKVAQINPQNIELWKKYLIGKNMKLSIATKTSYESDINQFFVYILDNYDNRFLFDIDVEEMSEIIEDYVAFCSNFLDNKTKRISRRLSTISSLYIYYKKKRKIKENPLDLIERPIVNNSIYEVKQTYLTKEQVELIRKELNVSNNIQLFLFFEFGLSTMARVNAISNVTIPQINLEERTVYDVKEKEGYLVDLFFSDKCKELIIKWIDYRKLNNINSDFLFITKNKNGWDKTNKEVMQSSWIKKIGKIINEPSFHVHDLRHSGSNLLYQQGASLETVSKLLNHKGTDVTSKHYLKTDFKKLQAEKDKFEI